MILTPTVRYILLAIFVLFSGKTKCLSENVKNHAGVWEITADNTKYESFMPILKGNGGDWQSDLKTGNINSETLNSNEAQDNFLRDDTETKCLNSLCFLLQKHRVIRQTNRGSLYPHLPTSYPYQPPNNAYPYNSNNQQYNSFSNATNPYNPPYSTYPQPNGSMSPYPYNSNNQQYNSFNNATNPYNPSYSTYPQPNGYMSPSYQRQPTNPPYHDNYTNNFNPSYSPNVRHTYPPSPKPNINRPYENNAGNSSNFYRPTHNPYSNNSTYRPTQFYSNTTNSNYPNSFLNYGNTYPPFNQRPPVNQTLGYNTIYANFYGANNSTPLNNSFNQQTPYYNLVNASYASYPNNNNQGPTYSPNRPYANNSERNHYNPHGYYPPSANYTHLNASGYLVNPSLNGPTTYNGTNVTSYPYYQPAPNKTPSPYNANIPQYNPPSGPNNFYTPYNNGPQYDPHKNTPQHFSYPPH